MASPDFPKGDKIKHPRTKRAWWAVPALAAALAGASLLLPPAGSSVARPSHQVSQRGREFRPGRLDVKRGDIVSIVNDDADLSHHAYVESSRFNFDSGDQEPGHDVEIPFNVAGTFNVLCGIHPKMHLVVAVH